MARTTSLRTFKTSIKNVIKILTQLKYVATFASFYRSYIFYIIIQEQNKQANITSFFWPGRRTWLHISAFEEHNILNVIKLCFNVVWKYKEKQNVRSQFFNKAYILCYMYKYLYLVVIKFTKIDSLLNCGLKVECKQIW